tara:strand:- start:3365 stop:3493 length:129 start_codon:yes stop_codon:yes gene_type:complete
MTREIKKLENIKNTIKDKEFINIVDKRIKEINDNKIITKNGY